MENTCVKVCLKLQKLKWLQIIKKSQTQTQAQVFSCEYWGNLKNTYFEEYLRTTASGLINIIPEHCFDVT